MKLYCRIFIKMVLEAPYHESYDLEFLNYLKDRNSSKSFSERIRWWDFVWERSLYLVIIGSEITDVTMICYHTYTSFDGLS